MKPERLVDYKLEKVLRLLERFSAGDFSSRESFLDEGDEVDEILRRLNSLGEKIQQTGQVINDYEKRVTAIMNVLLSYTFFDFSEKAIISETGDEIDAIALAVNTLGEELRDRIEAEQKHIARLEQLAVVMETTADGVMLLDPSGVIMQWNKSAERIFGRSRQDVIGKVATDLLSDEEHIKDVELLLARVKKGEQVINYETKRRHSNGAEVQLSLTLTPIYRGNELSSISVVSRDVTNEKRAQLLLKQNEERFRTLIEGVRDYAIIMLDPAGHISSWNAGATALHGYAEDEVTGQNFAVFFPSEEREQHVPANMLKEAIRQEKAIRDLYLVRSDGSAFWANVLVTSLRDNQQNLTGFSLITRDLSETRQKDEEIRQYTRKLEQKNLELEKKNKELSSFAYISSHDLQEPLRKIRTFCSRLLQTDLEHLSEKGKDYCLRMELAAHRMQSLIRDIIEYTTITNNEEKCEKCDLEKIVSEVVAEFSSELEKRKARIEVTGICSAIVIPRQFAQLMTNIISNSLKFSSEKRAPHITITGDTVSASEVTDRAGSTAEEYCRITVRDNGIGFEPHFNSQVFEVFQKLHGHDRFPGTGIGLAICKKIVENHRGTIEARGELGKGTTITICLPLDENGAED